MDFYSDIFFWGYIMLIYFSFISIGFHPPSLSCLVKYVKTLNPILRVTHSKLIDTCILNKEKSMIDSMLYIISQTLTPHSALMVVASRKNLDSKNHHRLWFSCTHLFWTNSYYTPSNIWKGERDHLLFLVWGLLGNISRFIISSNSYHA